MGYRTGGKGVTLNPIAQVIAAEWCAVLGNSNVTDEDEFFAIGGNSVQAVDLVARIEKRLGIGFPLEALFLDGTFGAVCHACAEALESKASRL
jgi:acyl carrier protein